jgi:hypothetical protein
MDTEKLRALQKEIEGEADTCDMEYEDAPKVGGLDKVTAALMKEELAARSKRYRRWAKTIEEALTEQ